MKLPLFTPENSAHAVEWDLWICFLCDAALVYSAAQPSQNNYIFSGARVRVRGARTKYSVDRAAFDSSALFFGLFGRGQHICLVSLQNVISRTLEAWIAPHLMNPKSKLRQV
jgi:hypothetical protein